MIVLQTERLSLHLWSRQDAAALSLILADRDVIRYIGTGEPFDPARTREFIDWAVRYQAENGFCRWKVVEKATNEIIGSCGFARPHGTVEPELGYLLKKSRWGLGLATEMTAACLHYGFKKLGFREIIALTDPANAASRRVLEKIGFSERGTEEFNGETALVYLAKKPL